MKKTYQKPDVFFEDFAFSSNIAGNCSALFDLHRTDNTCNFKATSASPETCTFEDNGFVVFQHKSGRDIHCQEDDPFNLCYHVSVDFNRIFNS